MENLRIGRFVVRIIQPDQCIPQKRGQLPSSRFQLRPRARRLDHLRQIRSDLQLRVVACVRSWRPLVLLTLAEDLPWKLEVAEFAREREQSVIRGLSLRHFRQTIAEGEERIDGNQALVIQDRADSSSQSSVHTLAIRAVP